MYLNIQSSSRHKALVLILFFIAFFSTSASYSFSQGTCPPNWNCQGGCTYVGQCVSNKKCELITFSTPILQPGSADCGSAIVGEITVPEGVKRYNLLAIRDGGNIGILVFVTRALQFFAVLCGLLVFFNILYGGYEYIVGAGKTDVHVKVRERLTWSVVGLILLIAAYMIAALIGLLIFGDPTFLLNPDLTKYGALAP